MNTTKKNKVPRYILLILLFPFLWIYGLYKLYKAYKANKSLPKKYITLSIVSIIFFSIAFSQTDKSDKQESLIAHSENSIESQISSKESATEPQTTIVAKNTTKQQTTTIVEHTTERQTTTVVEHTTEQQTTTVVKHTTEQQTTTAAEPLTEPQTNIETTSEAPTIIITEPVTEAITEAPPEPNVEIMVWVTKTGKKYHSISNCGNSKTSYQLPLSDAEARGLGSCKNCH